MDRRLAVDLVTSGQVASSEKKLRERASVYTDLNAMGREHHRRAVLSGISPSRQNRAPASGCRPAVVTISWRT
jgi:hypothetical protein